MFSTDVYVRRRRTLTEKMSSIPQGKRGIAIFLGNVEAPQNYRGNDYKFRQESSFLYYWGLDEPGLAAIIDLDSGEETLYGDNVDIDDIIWMGPQPDIRSKAEKSGAANAAPSKEFDAAVIKAQTQGRTVHFLPASRYYNTLKLSTLTGISPENVRRTRPVAQGKASSASEELVKAVISMRLIKEDCELEEIDKACEIGYLMHTEARRGCKPGAREQDIVGRMEGVTISKGWGVSFTTILSQNGETLHNHSHHQIITPGRMLLVDAGAESNTHYASDFTRTYPCSGRFTVQQKEIYDIVESCNELAFQLARPGVTYRQVHLAVAEGALRLGGSRLHRRLEVFFLPDDADAPAAAARARLDDDGIADLGSELFRLGNVCDLVQTGHDGNARRLHGAARLVLIAHFGDDRPMRADEFDVALFAQFGEARVFGQEAVAGVDRLAARRDGDVDDGGHVEVAVL